MVRNFFHYQQQRFSILLGWGLFSVVSGGMLMLSKSGFWKQMGLQFLTWGAIDAVLAALGIRRAHKNEQLYQQGELTRSQEEKEVRGLWRILAINTLLDVGYIFSGVWVIRRFQQRTDRQGAGIGIILQGFWLFLFDGLLSREVKRRWLS